MAKPKRNFMDALMNEPIRLPGCPQMIVTRAFAYTWLRDELGYDPKQRGVGSLDHMVFMPTPVDEPLTDIEHPVVQQALKYMADVENGRA
jgi:hypothetical protein